MDTELRNIGLRLVSFRCNSGEYCHLPPSAAVEVPEWEVDGNAMVEKLLERGLISRRKAAAKSAAGEKKKAATRKKSAGKKKPAARKKAAGRKRAAGGKRTATAKGGARAKKKAARKAPARKGKG